MGALPSNTIVGVVGAGTMGAGIAQVAAKAGHQVLLYDAIEGAADLGLERIELGLKKLVQRNKLSAAECDCLLSRITPCDSIESLAPAKLVVEAIVEKLEIKQQVFSRLENVCSEDTILATNTSSISVTAIGAGLSRPENFVGMHFFNPAPIMKLVEIISGVATDIEIAKTVFETAAAWGKKPVLARSTPGFIVNRVARPFYAESLRVKEVSTVGVSVLDAIMRESGGFRMGPFELMDLIGHDVNYAVTCSVFDAFFKDSRFKPSLLQQELVNAGYLGRKTGRGFYRYDNDDKGCPVENLNSNKTNVNPSKITEIEVLGSLGVAESLIDLAHSIGVVVERVDHQKRSEIRFEGVSLMLTDGRSATQVSAEEGQAELVLFDLAMDYRDADRIAVTKSDQCSERGLKSAASFFERLGKQVSVIDDVPGMVVMRTVCMLANEGADAVNQNVCTAEAVDLAMQAGVNYPRGPLAWADFIGLHVVVNCLDNLACGYGESRYRVSPLLRRKGYSETTFFEKKANTQKSNQALTG